MRRAVQPRLSAESGFWKTIWIERLSSVGRFGRQRRQRRGRRARARRRRRAPRCRGSSWPASTCPSPTRRRARASRRRTGRGPTLTSAGTSWPLWWNVFDTLVSDSAMRRRGRSPARRSPAARPARRAGRRGGSGVQRPAPTSTTGGDDGPAQVGGERAAVDEHAGRQVRADLRQVARDRRQRPLRLADAVARQRAQQAERVRVLRARRRPSPRRPPRRSCRRTSRRPGRTASG